MKKQIGVRLSQATLAKLKELQKKYGTQTEVLAVAIDRLYTAEAMLEKYSDNNGADNVQRD